MKHSKFKQRLFVTFLFLVGLGAGGALVLPSLLNIDRYRPLIEKLAQEKLQGSLSLGKLQLTLLGKIAVQVERAELLDLEKKPLVSVGKFELAFPVLKILKGSPEIQIRMIQPQIYFERNSKGDFNMTQIIRKNSEEKAKGSEEVQTPASVASTEAMPSFLKRAGLSLFIQDADLKFTDQKSRSDYQLKKVGIQTGVLTLDKLPTFLITADLNTQIGKEGKVSGPFRMEAQSKDNGVLLQGYFNDLAIDWNQSFQKKAGTPLEVSAHLSKDKNKVMLQEGTVIYEKAKVGFSGDFFQSEEGQEAQGNLWVKLTSFPFRGPYFKQDLDISGEAKLTLDSIEQSIIQLKGKSFELVLNTQVNSFSDPQVKVDIVSSGMDLDELFDWKAMKEAKKNKEPEARSQPVTNSSSATTKESSPAQKALGRVWVQIKSLKAYNVLIEPIKGQFNLKNLKLEGSFDEAQVLGGKLRLGLNVDASQKELQYSFQGQMKNVSLANAVASQVEWLKNTLVGSLDGELSGTGSGMNAEKAKQNLKMTGKVQVRPAKLSTIDINQMVSQGVTSAISKAGDKIPGLKGKQLKIDPVSSEFQQMTSSFSIKDGVFFSPDFYAQAVPRKGLEAKGVTRLDIRDFSLDAHWDISDPYNLLKMNEVSVEEGGVRVESILLEKGKAFYFPVKIRGNLFKPDYDYGAIPETLASIALKNVSFAVQERAKGELKKQAQEKLKQVTDKAPPQVQQILKGIFK